MFWLIVTLSLSKFEMFYVHIIIYIRIIKMPNVIAIIAITNRFVKTE